jgi:aminoglycoside phosphotransferase (APT) family kinase protein
VFEGRRSSGSADGWPSARAVVAAFGLGRDPVEMVPVTGAWSNRVFRLVVGGEAFALKELRNPWSDTRWLEWLDASWDFELKAIEAGVDAPEPVANPDGGHCLAWVARDDDGPPVPVRVHRWVDGRRAESDPVGREVARWAGRTLAMLHELAVRPADRTLFPRLNTDTADRWSNLTEAALQANAPWADQLGEVADAVAVIADLARAGGEHPDAEVMTHGDMDQKNIVLGRSGPVLCDWDLVVPLVPHRELADAALSLGAWRRLDVGREVVAAYCQARDATVTIEPADLGQSMMTGLDWIGFNVERAIGLRATGRDESDTAQRIVPSLLEDLPKKVDLALHVRDALNT